MSKNAEQLSFQGQGLQLLGAVFGGSNLTSHPKTKRPLNSRLPIHLVLRAQRSVLKSPTTFAKVNEIVRTVATRHGIKIYSYANVGNHLHLLIRISRRARWSGFIRDLTGQIALYIRKRLNLQIEGSLWTGRPYTRMIQGWRKAFRVAKAYLYLNQIQAEGFISAREVRTLKELRRLWSG